MNKKGEGNLVTGILMVFIMIILALALMQPVANTRDLIAEKQPVFNESFSLSSCYATSETKTQVNVSSSACNDTVLNVPTGWQLTSADCAISSVTVKNGTNGANLTLNTDYRLFAQTGIIQFLNTSNTASSPGNITYSYYEFCNLGYIPDAGTRSITSLWTLLMIIALLAGVVAFAYKIFKDKQ